MLTMKQVITSHGLSNMQHQTTMEQYHPETPEVGALLTCVSFLNNFRVTYGHTDLKEVLNVEKFSVVTVTMKE